MELKELSSNWKKLQQALRGDEPAVKDQAHLKRSAASSDNLQQRKRQRLSLQNKTIRASKRQRKGNDMGLILTKETQKSTETSQSKQPSASLALWAEDSDIPAKDLSQAYGVDIKSTVLPKKRHTSDPSPENASVNGGLSISVEIGKYVALDCEMVGVSDMPDTPLDEQRSALARVSLVNYHGDQIYDSFVRPLERVLDWRTHVSGIRPSHMQEAREFSLVQQQVADILQDRILVGHAITNDLGALMLKHPKRDIRDTSRLPSYRALAGGKNPALKKLAREVLGVDIQGGEHSSVEDARATMLLFRRAKDEFEREIARRYPAPKPAVVRGETSLKSKKPRKKKKKGRR